jgi:hypothetical protein
LLLKAAFEHVSRFGKIIDLFNRVKSFYYLAGFCSRFGIHLSTHYSTRCSLKRVFRPWMIPLGRSHQKPEMVCKKVLLSVTLGETKRTRTKIWFFFSPLIGIDNYSYLYQ